MNYVNSHFPRNLACILSVVGRNDCPDMLIGTELKVLEKDLEKAFHIHLTVDIILAQSFDPVSRLIAGFILATPLPDELATSLFSVIRFNAKRFLVLTYAIKLVGILAIVLSPSIF